MSRSRCRLVRFVVALGVLACAAALVWHEGAFPPNEIWIHVERPFVMDPVDFRAYATSTSPKPICARLDSYGRSVRISDSRTFHRMLAAIGLAPQDGVWYYATSEVVDFEGRTMARYAPAQTCDAGGTER